MLSILLEIGAKTGKGIPEGVSCPFPQAGQQGAASWEQLGRSRRPLEQGEVGVAQERVASVENQASPESPPEEQALETAGLLLCFCSMQLVHLHVDRRKNKRPG